MNQVAQPAATPEQMHGHGLALAMRGRCPMCAEIAAQPNVLSDAPCSSCGGVLTNGLTADAVMQEYRARSLERVGLILGLASLASLLLGMILPLLGVIVVPIALIAFRVTVVSPALYLMARRRRLVSRWTMRLAMTMAFSVAGAILTLLSTVPVVGGVIAAVTTPLVLAMVWYSGRAYLTWQLARERDGTPVSFFEIALLAGTLLAVLFAAALLATLVAVTIQAVQSAVEWVTGLVSL